ncbi:hypothetical protein NP233_g1941 [Leucocoprinus birnbaumii]|uniref:G domain-containing protein n=1 Tax=Leucocoprinus birnbaumii TaxID=56174 RepID=A0AAD5YZD4_9AGAR|nr:hypothetical protein NP233_g1941 [Leucocoprinus birnbaumii]
MGGTLSRLLHVEEIEQSDIIIAVVGQSGVGKSTFINIAAGKDILPVNNRLKPEPSEVRHIECTDSARYGDRRVVFVDTPGFDSERDEKKVEKEAEAMDDFSRKARISGILYLHRITDPKLTDPPAQRLARLKSLCEDSVGGFPSRVILVTTMWECLPSSNVGEGRQEELQKYWDTYMPRGKAPSTVQRFQQSSDNAWAIVFALLGADASGKLNEGGMPKPQN